MLSKTTATFALAILQSSCVFLAPSQIAGKESTSTEAGDHWSCFTEPEGLLRREQVINGLLPRVAFVGETEFSDVETRMHRHNAPALSVAVIRAGKLDWTAAWGSGSVNGERVDCSTLFQAGSLAKPVTALAALRLQQAGILDFNLPIDDYLDSWQLPPGHQTDANPVTFRNLLKHTSGITPGGYQGYEQGEPIPEDLQIVQGYPPSNSDAVEVLEPPGSVLAYSGGGYTLIEIALQDTLGDPFEKIMHDWLIEPVGMKQADFALIVPTASNSPAARGHHSDGKQVAGGWRQHPEQAAAGLWSTASDLAVLLVEMHLALKGKSDVFGEESMFELLADPFAGHLYGFRLVSGEDEQFLAHYGATVGYRSAMIFNPQSGDGAVYLSNSDNGTTLGREFLAAVSRVYEWPILPNKWVERASPSEELLRSLNGRYLFEGGLAVSVEYRNEGVTIIFPNDDRYLMVPIVGEGLQFIHPRSAVQASFSSDKARWMIELYGEIGERVDTN